MVYIIFTQIQFKKNCHAWKLTVKRHLTLSDNFGCHEWGLVIVDLFDNLLNNCNNLVNNLLLQ